MPSGCHESLSREGQFFHSFRAATIRKLCALSNLSGSTPRPIKTSFNVGKRGQDSRRSGALPRSDKSRESLGAPFPRLQCPKSRIGNAGSTRGRRMFANMSDIRPGSRLPAGCLRLRRAVVHPRPHRRTRLSTGRRAGKATAVAAGASASKRGTLEVANAQRPARHDRQARESRLPARSMAMLLPHPGVGRLQGQPIDGYGSKVTGAPMRGCESRSAADTAKRPGASRWPARPKPATTTDHM